ncbi:MAG: hypothetical protein ACI4KF_10390 [Huintestinicola sp.]
MTRTESSLKNLVTALVGQAAGIIITFFSRKVFLSCLDEEYLGVSGLFTNILTVLSLAELGVGTAMVYALYKPLADNDIPMIKSLMALYKKAYRIIGCTVLLLALALTPFYTFFMDRVPEIPHLTAVYLLFAANTGISYFYAYKRSLIICDQKRYIATIYRYGFFFLLNAVQIIVLLTTGSYLLFLVMQVVFTWAENIAVSVKADRMYPYLREKNAPLPDKETTDSIKDNIGAMMFHKLGGVVVMSTDNILLSKLVGLASVGIYSNYYFITNALNTIITQVFNSLSASVGNLNACEGTSDKLTDSFYRIFFLNFWIYGFCTSCLYVLFDPFISLWLGDDLLFDRMTVVMIVLSFWLTGMRKTGLVYREASGAYVYDKYKPLAESAINIIASVMLARYMGAAGIFAGTVISTLTTCFWVEPLVVFRHVLGRSWGKYWGRYLLYAVCTAASCLLCSLASECFGGGIVGFMGKLAVCAVIPNILYAIVFFRTDEFAYFFGIIKTILLKKQHK